ncbi:MAG: serine/threonine protein kinase [Chloroflexi bacterium]|nr:serine/threonine protein kinase [Chloroflexota bacterium]MBK6712975.1 serine/threonine protein kinase [Chloroflexota bacterium]MBK8931970.1 serine/threonine protein kinase [Chloroflexota bacterium]MBP6804017.1 serine/threonine protein kinase [Chloroflexota bacterium]MBP7590575.1 serine/threonine protein kinase [Chloroflexota bacterium]
MMVHTNNTILRERYKITNIVGQGGMGSVYRAEDLRLPGRLCAIKAVEPDPNFSPELQQQAQSQFLQEASILAQLDHPNLPKVSDFFSENGRDYLVMDFVPGKDLRELLVEAGGPLAEKLVLKWAEQIIDALAYLHQQDPPILHRDIKPGNIKLTPDGRIKLVDFGLVKLMVPDDSRTITVVQGRGTALYTPLEQYGGDGGHTDARTDVYALAATFYHLLTNVPPPDAKLRFLNPRILQPPEDINETISHGVSEAIMWALEMHPDQRPESVQAFYQVFTGNQPRPGRENDLTAVTSILNALRANWVTAVFVLTLFFVAVLLTIL